MDAKKMMAAPQPGQDALVDELFGALKGGNLFKNRRAEQKAAAVTARPPIPQMPSQAQMPQLKKTPAPSPKK